MLDAAVALSRSPMFKLLGRLDLAKLAGELEEVVLGPEEILFQQGDPGDAFYVIRSGQAQVYVGDRPDQSRPILLGAGSVIGEMAILTEEPRSATIIAVSRLALWRMTAPRFIALLNKERLFATAIERALSQRLATLNNDTEQWKQSFNELLGLTLHLLEPAARQMLVRLSLRERWSAASIAAIRSDAADSAALDQVIANDVLLKSDGDEVVVMPPMVGLLRNSLGEEDRQWLGNLGERLAASGALSEAVFVLLLGGEAKSAAQIVAENGADFCDVLSPKTRADWLFDIERAGLAQELESRVRERLSQPEDELRVTTEPMRDDTPAQPALFTRLINNSKSISVVLSLIILAAGWLLPVPEGLSRNGFAALMCIGATVPLMLSETLPLYMVTILLAASLIIPGIASPEMTLSGFATTSWLMIVVLFAVSSAIAKSGLLYRVALLMLKIMPGNIIVQAFSLLGLSMVLSTGVSSGNARVALAVPAVRDLAEAMKLGRHGRGSVFLGLISYQVFTGMGPMFITSSSAGLLLYGMLPEPYHSQISWMSWLLASLVPHLIIFLLYLGTLLVMVRPPIKNEVDQKRIELQLALLGPLTRREIFSIIALCLLGLGFATRGYHGLADVWTALAVCMILFASKSLDDRSFLGGVNWGTALFFGVLISLTKVVSSLGIDHWLTDKAGGVLVSFVHSPFAFVAILASLAYGLRFILPSLTLSSMLALLSMPLAISAGYSPLVPVLILLVATEHTCFPFINASSYYSMAHASEGYMYTYAQARYPMIAESLLRIVALIASVPLWMLMGLM